MKSSPQQRRICSISSLYGPPVDRLHGAGMTTTFGQMPGSPTSRVASVLLAHKGLYAFEWGERVRIVPGQRDVFVCHGCMSDRLGVVF